MPWFRLKCCLVGWMLCWGMGMGTPLLAQPCPKPRKARFHPGKWYFEQSGGLRLAARDESAFSPVIRFGISRGSIRSPLHQHWGLLGQILPTEQGSLLGFSYQLSLRLPYGTSHSRWYLGIRATALAYFEDFYRPIQESIYEQGMALGTAVLTWTQQVNRTWHLLVIIPVDFLGYQQGQLSPLLFPGVSLGTAYRFR